MPLHLVLGPANARKVGQLLDRHEQAARDGRTAWFVVPSSGDVERFRRELAGIDHPPGRAPRTPTPFGRVMVGRVLEQELLKRVDPAAALLSRDHRRAVALAAIRDGHLQALAPAARSGWLADQLVDLSEELSTTRHLGGAAEEALRRWSGMTSDARGRELADLLGADAAILTRLAEQARPRLSRATAARRIGDAITARPALLAGVHLVLSGFDDLDAVQRSLVLAAARSEASVVLSLPYQEGREVLQTASGLVGFLEPATTSVDTRGNDPESADLNPTLSRVERRLYEQVVFAAPDSAAPGGAAGDDDRTAEPFDGDPLAPELGPLVAHDDDPLAPALGPLVAYDDADLTENAARVDEPTAEAPAPAPTAPRPGAALFASTHEPAAEPDQADAPVLELRGGGPDEEAALIATHLRTLAQRGIEPGRIAVAVPDPGRQGPVLVAALQRAGVAAHLSASRPSVLWPSVSALVGLLKAADEGGTPRDLVDWLAGPGAPEGRAAADALDATARRHGASTAHEAQRLWSKYLGHGALPEFDALQAMVRSARRDATVRERGRARRPAARPADPGVAPPYATFEEAVADILRTRLAAASSAPGALDPAAQRDLRAAAQILAVIDPATGRDPGLLGLTRLVPELSLGLAELRELIATTPSPADQEPAGSIAVVGPLDVRTRYLQVLVVARAQRGSFPAAEPVRRVLGPGDRATLRELGWPAPVRPEHAAAERYLAYEVVARPTTQLVLAWHDGDGDGKPCEPSPLLAEVRRAVGDPVPVVSMPSGAAARHGLASERAARIAGARSGPRHREPTPDQSPLLAAREHDRHAVGALQTASRCAAQWFVDHHLRPQPLSPDAAPLTAGRLRHEMLAEVVGGVVRRRGIPLAPEALPALQLELDEAAARRAPDYGETLAERLMRERVVAEIAATLPALCGTEQLEHQPAELELAFGTTPRGSDSTEADATAGPTDELADDLRPPVTIERAGETLTLAGRIDRLDAAPNGELVVVDYKGANVDAYRGGGWIENRELQAGLYALAAERLVGGGSHAVASLYQPVPGPAGQAPRGATAEPLRGRGPISRNDRLDPDSWDELLDALVALAGEAQRRIDDGIVEPDPSRCSAGGCRHPWLCREVQA